MMETRAQFCQSIIETRIIANSKILKQADIRLVPVVLYRCSLV